MKLVKIKNLTKPVRCSFCKERQTTKRIQGYPYFGRSCCEACFAIKDQAKREYDAKWSDREESIGESMIPYI